MDQAHSLEDPLNDTRPAMRLTVTLAMVGASFREEVESRLLRNQPQQRLRQMVSTEIGRRCAQSRKFARWWNGLSKEARRAWINESIRVSLEREAEKFPPEAPLATYLAAFQ